MLSMFVTSASCSASMNWSLMHITLVNESLRQTIDQCGNNAAQFDLIFDPIEFNKLGSDQSRFGRAQCLAQAHPVSSPSRCVVGWVV